MKAIIILTVFAAVALATVAPATKAKAAIEHRHAILNSL